MRKGAPLGEGNRLVNLWSPKSSGSVQMETVPADGQIPEGTERKQSLKRWGPGP